MKIILDDIQVVFWSITYILSIVYALRKKTHIIPHPAILCNLAWETVALLCHGMIGHIVWFSLDVVIAFLFLLRVRYSKKAKAAWIICLLFMIAVLWKVFRGSNGMLISVFAIDLLMAILFCLKLWRDRSGSILGLCIAVTKLIGDLAAWCVYSHNSFVYVTGIVVLICNIAYLVYMYVCLRKCRYEKVCR